MFFTNVFYYILNKFTGESEYKTQENSQNSNSLIESRCDKNVVHDEKFEESDFLIQESDISMIQKKSIESIIESINNLNQRNSFFLTKNELENSMYNQLQFAKHIEKSHNYKKNEKRKYFQRKIQMKYSWQNRRKYLNGISNRRIKLLNK